MGLKWFESEDIVSREATVTRQKTERVLADLAEKQRLRREQAEEEARQTGRWNAQLATSFAQSYQRASAADEIDEANKALTGLGWDKLIPISESSISSQIMSGGNWAQEYAELARRASRADREAKVRVEAEQWAKWTVSQAVKNKVEGAVSWADLSPDGQQTKIDTWTTQLLQKYYPDEYGEPEPTVPMTTTKLSKPTKLALDRVSQTIYGKNYDELDINQRADVDEHFPSTISVPTTEGIPFTLTTEDGEDVELTYRQTDSTVWQDDKLVGTIDTITGDFVPKEPSVGIKILRGTLKALNYVFYPFTAFGMLVWSSGQSSEQLQELSERAEQGDYEASMALQDLLGVSGQYTPTEPTLVGQTREKLGVADYTPGKEWLPGGETYEKYRELPWYKQLLYEAPAWALLGVSGGATGASARLLPQTARTGVGGWLARTAYRALAPGRGLERGLERAIGGIIRRIPPLKKYLIDRPLETSIRNYIKQQTGREATQLEINLVKDMVVGMPTPQASAKLQEETIRLLAQRFGSQAVGRYYTGGRQMSEAVIKDVIAHAKKVGDTELQNAAERFLKQWLASKTAEAQAELMRGDLFIKWFGKLESGGVQITDSVISEIARMAAAEAEQYYPTAYHAALALEGQEAAHTLVVDNLAQLFNIPIADITAETIANIFGRGVLPLTGALIEQLTNLGVTNAEKMSAEEAWAALFKGTLPATQAEEIPVMPTGAEVTPITPEVTPKAEAGMPEAIPPNAITEVEELFTKIGEEWIGGRPGVGLTNNQIARAKAGVASIAKKYGVDKNVLWQNVWWEAEIKPATPEQPATDEEIEALIKSVSGKAEAGKPAAITEEITATREVTPEIASFEARQLEIKSLLAKPIQQLPKGTTKIALQQELRELSSQLIPAERTLRQTIMATVKSKGLPIAQYRKIFLDKGGSRLLTNVSYTGLNKILGTVRKARPTRIVGKVVITPKTETKITSLKSGLEARGQMDDANFARIMSDLGLKTDKYESTKSFITEGEGKGLIRAMLDEAEIIGEQTRIAKALAKHPDIAQEVEGIDRRNEHRKVVEVLGQPQAHVNPLWDMEYYGYELQLKTGKPIGDAYNRLIRAYSGARYAAQWYASRLENSTPHYRAIIADDKALKRVSDYIASKNKLGPEYPSDIKPEEIKLAKEMERHFAEFQGVVRQAKFLEAYYAYDGNPAKMRENLIPDAPVEDLRRAVDIYEGKGKEALIDFLGTKDWGVVKSGYEPLSVVNPRIYLHRAPATTTLGKGHIRVRRSIQYTVQEHRNIIQRYNGYVGQILGLDRLQSPIRNFVRAFDETAPYLKMPRVVAASFEHSISEFKGYRDLGGPLGTALARLYGQTIAAVFWQPHLWFRNFLIQNFGFHPDRLRMFLPDTYKKMESQRYLYHRVFVSQMSGLRQDYMMERMKPLPGLRWITRLAKRTNQYGNVDELNRIWSQQMRYGRIDPALAQYGQDGNLEKLIYNSGLYDLEPLQQKHALHLLAQDTVTYTVPGLEPVSGQEAFARYIAEKITKAIHFSYDRGLRAPVEQGSLGIVIGNLMTFPRSYGQRLYQLARKLKPSSAANTPEKKVALRSLLGMLICGTLVGEFYRRITGMKRNPGNPLNIMQWSPGGLLVGTVDQITQAMWDTATAAMGDRDALGRVTSSLPAVPTLLLPWYKLLIHTLESATGKENIDRYTLRKLREAIDKEYSVREDAYLIERTWYEQIRHALFGGETSEEVLEEREAEETRTYVLDEISQYLYGKKFDELNEEQQAVVTTLSAAD